MRQLLALAAVTAWIGWVGAGTGLRAAQTWTGVISDSQCGGNHGGEVDERECTLKCTKSGDKFVLVTNYGNQVWPISNQDFAELPQHAGHTVKLTGEMKGSAIVVSTIAMQ